METDDFDDAFSHKIDDVKQKDISDNEVEKIINYVNQKRSASNRKSYLLYGFSILSIAAIAGLLTWNIAQMQQKRSLENTINSFEHNKAANLKENNFAVKRDTIYIKEYVQSADNYIEIEEAKKTIGSQNKLISILRNKLKINNTTNETSAALYSTILKDKNNTTIAYIKKKNDFVLLTDNPVATNDLIFQTLRSTDSITDQPIEQKLNFRNFSYQLGIGSHIADDQKSFSILMGINLNKHWNISTGINLLQIDNNTYNDKDDSHYYANLSEIKDGSLASFRDIKQTIYQVPITINYLIPLAKKLSLLCGIGTDFDLYATQHLDYEIKINTSQEEEKIVNKKAPVLVFNNAVISVGINKEWKHFSIQLSPFINPPITRVLYKSPESYYGGRIRLFYNF